MPSRTSVQPAIDRLWPGKGLQLPASCYLPQWFQKGGWSCGYQCLEYVERQVRQSLGQPPIPFQPPASRILLGNGFLQKLQDCKDAAEGAPKPGPKAPAPVPKAPAPELKAPAPEPKPSSSKAKASKEEPATLEAALAAAKACGKCKARLYGFKGCSQCMGDWLALYRQKR